MTTMNNFIPISNGESGLSVRQKLNEFLSHIPTEVNQVGQSVNNLDTALSDLQATERSDIQSLRNSIAETNSTLETEVERLVALISAVSGSDTIVSAIMNSDAANNFPDNVSVVLIVMCNGDLVNFRGQDQQVISVDSSYPYVLLSKRVGQSYWSLTPPAVAVDSSIDDEDISSVKTWSSHKINEMVTPPTRLLKLMGRVDNYSDLANIQNPEPGWTYLVGREQDEEKAEYAYTDEGTWEAFGKNMEVDNELNLLSENPVQNKVLASRIQLMESAINSKLPNRQFDNVPTENSDNLVTSGAVYDAIQGGGGGEQLQADWEQNDDTKKDYIKHKPTIPAAQIQSDWAQSVTTEKDYIKNKPAIPSKTSDLTNDSGFLTQHQDISGKQDVLVSGTNIKTINGASVLGGGNIQIDPSVQPDWNEQDSSANDYIKNKPTIPAKTTDLTNDSGFVSLRERMNAQGYRQLNYIEATGEQVIATGITPTQDTGFELDYMSYDAPTSTNSPQIINAGGRGTQPRLAVSLWVANKLSGEVMVNTTSSTAKMVANSRMLLKYINDGTNQKIIYSDGEVKTLPSVSSFTVNGTLHLFAMLNAGVFDRFFRGRLYGFKIYNLSSLAYNFVPAIRLSDNEVGLYETEHGVFYTNDGSGTFGYEDTTVLTRVSQLIIDRNIISDNNFTDVYKEQIQQNADDIAELQQSVNGKQDTIDSSHKLSADLVQDGDTNKVFTATEKTKLAGLSNYTLPTASENTLGGVKVGTGLSINQEGVLSASAQAQQQADWLQDNTSAPDYIKHKPEMSFYTLVVEVDNDNTKKAIVIPRYEHKCGDVVRVMCNMAGLDIEPEVQNCCGELVVFLDGTEFPSSLFVHDDAYYTPSRVPIMITVYRIGNDYIPTLNWAAFRLFYMDDEVTITQNQYVPKFSEGDTISYNEESYDVVRGIPDGWIENHGYGWGTLDGSRFLVIPESVTFNGEEMDSDDFRFMQNYAYNNTNPLGFIFLKGSHDTSYWNASNLASISGEGFDGYQFFDYAGGVSVNDIPTIKIAANDMKAYRLLDTWALPTNEVYFYSMFGSDWSLERLWAAQENEPHYIPAGSYVGVKVIGGTPKLVLLDRSDIHPWSSSYGRVFDEDIMPIGQ